MNIIDSNYAAVSTPSLLCVSVARRDVPKFFSLSSVQQALFIRHVEENCMARTTTFPVPIQNKVWVLTHHRVPANEGKVFIDIDEMPVSTKGNAQLKIQVAGVLLSAIGVLAKIADVIRHWLSGS